MGVPQNSALSHEASRALDDYLVVAAQSGDGAALNQLVRRWHRRLVAHAWRLTGRHDAAEEVAQIAWVEIVRGLPKLRDERAFRVWAYRIVTRHSAKRVGQIVAERAAINSLSAEAGAAECETSPQGVNADRLHRAIATLSPAHRAAVALHYFEGLSVAEVAVALDAPSGTIKTRLMHARNKLRTHFKGDDDA